ncbi:MAG: asparaginase [Euryarchaeota archaeon]|nr:asparaginase [Euryarchaeota archaeon]
MDPVAVRFVRGETVESVHRVSVAVADARGRLAGSFGDPRLVTFLRSSAKPMQLVPLVESGAADRFAFTPKELAIIAGSHGGEPDHIETVRGILAKIGLGEDSLQCGRHAPYHKESAERVGNGFTSLHHNCSGKHSGMLALAVHMGWDPRSYLAAEGPVQQAILKVVAKECGLAPDRIPIGLDGCGVSSFGVPLKAGARAFARLANPETIQGRRGVALRRIRDAMLAHPEMVAGTDRLDTDLMRRLAGRIVVKAGAEACYGAALVGRGLGVCLKVEDGGSRAVGPALVRVLEELGAISAPEKNSLRRHWGEPLQNVAGRVVGRVECDFRLRIPRRAVAATA